MFPHFTIHPAGWPIVIGVTLVFLILTALWPWFLVLAIVAIGSCAYFFRHPTRVTPKRRNLVVAPADGLVIEITKALPPYQLEMEMQEMIRISVFLSIFDVHVNWTPVSAKVEKIHRCPGAFHNASKSQSSDENERVAIRLLCTQTARHIALVQVAGLIARRIVCSLQEGQKVARGQTFGIIRFGSRVDLYLPQSADVLIDKGQRMIGGETVIATLQAKTDADVCKSRGLRRCRSIRRAP